MEPMTTIRFGAGGPEGPRSALWSLWVGKRTSDVYVESRDVNGVMKFSLHESGDWHYGYRSEYVQSEKMAGRGVLGGRWKTWKRPATFKSG